MLEPKPKRSASVSRAEFEELKRALVASEKMLAEARTDAASAASAAAETHDKVADMHKALMVPTPGQDKCLLDRMATVTINVESGGRIAGFTVKLAGALAAIGAIGAILHSLTIPR